jgi:hypothetical protein
MEEAALVAMTRTDPQLLERIVRVEEELKSQPELMKQGFKQIDKRFEQVDKRLESGEKRFDLVVRLLSIGFVALTVLMTV